MSIGISLNYFENVITALKFIKNDNKVDDILLLKINHVLNMINNRNIVINRKYGELTGLKACRELYINILYIEHTLYFYFNYKYNSILINDYSNNTIKHTIYNVLNNFTLAFCNEIGKQYKILGDERIKEKLDELIQLTIGTREFFNIDGTTYSSKQKHDITYQFINFINPSINSILNKIFEFVDEATSLK